MKFYCICFTRTYPYCNHARHKFFVYAKTRLEAVKRFCMVTGYKSDCIISVHVVSREKKENKINGIDGRN